MVFVANLNYIAVAVVGALQVTAGAMTIGGLQAFIQFSRLFSQPMGQIGGMLTLLQSCLASAERVFELLDAPEIPPDSAAPARSTASANGAGRVRGKGSLHAVHGAHKIHAPGKSHGRHASRAGDEAQNVPAAAAVAGRVTFEHVSFGYSPGTPVVKDLSFTVEPGQTVAIVGHTGAGKTTVVSLLMRFYELDSGRITGGLDRHLHHPAGRAPVHLRHRPAGRLAVHRQHQGEHRVRPARGRRRRHRPAARASHVDHFVRSLPSGYATMVGNDGDSLSRGQRQLVSIARAQLAGRSILVLDEATSSVDSRTEVQIRHAMARLREGHTSFVIAHRLSTVRDADLILVMDHGRIVEHGTHQQLMAGSGLYKDLYEAQFAGREQVQAVPEPEQ